MSISQANQAAIANEIEAETDNRENSTRIRLRVDKQYSQEPVISRLVSDYGLSVNISAALLSPNGQEDGWFDLLLQGPQPQIRSALVYLQELDLEIISETTAEVDGW